MKKNGWKGFCKKLYKYRVFLLMLAPAVIYTLIFSNVINLKAEDIYSEMD